MSWVNLRVNERGFDPLPRYPVGLLRYARNHVLVRLPRLTVPSVCIVPLGHVVHLATEWALPSSTSTTLAATQDHRPSYNDGIPYPD